MIIDSFFVHSAKMVQLLYGAVFYEGIGYTDTSEMGNIVIVRHELQYGTAHSSFFDTVFYGDDMLEVESHLVQQGFVERLEKQLAQLRTLPVPAKFGGATGNFNAHHVAYPAVDWVAFANGFVNDRLGLERSQYTTQIEHYDNLAAIFANLKRIDTVLIDLCRDMWMYISMEYFKQRIKAGEVGSSAMPHKVNPIDFENAEGNFGIANAIYEHLASKLPLSRLQRDLTDSTVLRNVGVPMAHSLIGLRSLLKGLNKLLLNREALDCDLENNWAVVAEGIQTVLRRAGYPSPYEALKALTRTNAHITRESIAEFIESLDVAESVKQELRAITPQSYTGVFE